MKQRVTRVLFEYWDGLRGSRPAPNRSDVDPGAIRSCLANTFVLTSAPEPGHAFRIAGTSVCAMFGSELTGTPFDRLWAAEQRPAVCDLIGNVTEGLDGVVAGVTGRNDDAETADLEMILLPLTGTDGGTGRVLGALTVVAAPYWLGTRPLTTLSLGETHYAGAAGTKRLALGGNSRSRGRGFIIDPAAARRISRSFHG
jgi:hypothetical protein